MTEPAGRRTPATPGSGGRPQPAARATRRPFRCLLRLPAAAALFLALAACAGTDGPRRGAFPDYRLPEPAAMPEPIAQRPGRGALILHGGGYAARPTLDRIVARAGLAPALCVIDTASEGDGESGRFFRGYEALKLRAITIDGTNADAPATIEALRGCSAYFFGGGDPQRLSEAFRPGGRESAALATIRERFERRGATVAGSSAGAMIAGPVTLCECGQSSSIAALLQGTLFQAPGFDLVHGVLVDAHFFARGLLGRHLYALARNGVRIGVGIDEETAVIVPGDGDGDGALWEVVGSRAVAVIEAPPDASTDALHGFTLSLLSPGDRFDPLRGTFVVAPERRPMHIDASEARAQPIAASDIFASNRIPELLIRLVRGPATEAVGTAAHRSIRVTFRETDTTEAYFDGTNYSILRVSAGIERGGV